MILDEATSSVDVTTEEGIMQAMEQLMETRTTVMVAHRLSTLALCDTRLVLEGGQVLCLQVDARQRHLPAARQLPSVRPGAISPILPPREASE